MKKLILLSILFIPALLHSQETTTLECDCEVRNAIYFDQDVYIAGLVTMYDDQLIFSFETLDIIVFKKVNYDLFLDENLEFREIKNHINMYYFEKDSTIISFIY